MNIYNFCMNNYLIIYAYLCQTHEIHKWSSIIHSYSLQLFISILTFLNDRWREPRQLAQAPGQSKIMFTITPEDTSTWLCHCLSILGRSWIDPEVTWEREAKQIGIFRHPPSRKGWRGDEANSREHLTVLPSSADKQRFFAHQHSLIWKTVEIL